MVCLQLECMIYVLLFASQSNEYFIDAVSLFYSSTKSMYQLLTSHIVIVLDINIFMEFGLTQCCCTSTAEKTYKERREEEDAVLLECGRLSLWETKHIRVHVYTLYLH